MNARQSQLTGRLRLRHLLEVTEAKAEEMVAERPRFERLADPASAPRVVSAPQLFQTPAPLAARLADMFPAFGRTLEPSAGLGRLYQAVRAREPRCPITLVETAADCAGELYRVTADDTACQLLQRDFLECTVTQLGKFDSIIMNPPFRLGADIRHIRHALQFLAPGGRLVAICAAGPRQRAAFQDTADQWIDLPAGSFKEAFTNVAAAIVVFRN